MKESISSVSGRMPARSREERWVGPIEEGAGTSGAAVESLQRDRDERIAVNAYYKAERRGFAADHELEDWLEAERELSGVGTSAGMQNEEER